MLNDTGHGLFLSFIMHISICDQIPYFIMKEWGRGSMASKTFDKCHQIPIYILQIV